MFRLFQAYSSYFQRWSLAVLDETKGRWRVEPRATAIPYLKAMNRRGCHILLKPSEQREPYYLLCDDLTATDLLRDHRRKGHWKAGRFVVETSPGNFQVWIQFDRPLSYKEKVIWLERLGSDPACSPRHRWGRCPGFRNRKERYNQGGCFPLAKLIWIDDQSTAVIPRLHSSEYHWSAKKKHHSFPSSPKGGMCAFTVHRSDYERGNESATDFSYTLALLRRSVSPAEVTRRLLLERKDWTNHQGAKRQQDYISKTIRQASLIIERG